MIQPIGLFFYSIHSDDSYGSYQSNLSQIECSNTSISALASPPFGTVINITQQFAFNLEVKDGPERRLTDESLAFQYTFPVPPSGAITSFVATINNTRKIIGKCKPTKTAKEEYSEALKEGKKFAGLATVYTDDIFKVALGNIPPNKESIIEVQISYFTPMEYDSQYDGHRLSIPSSIFPRYGSPPSMSEDSQPFNIKYHSTISGASPKFGTNIKVEYTSPSLEKSESSLELKCISHPEKAKINDNVVTYNSGEKEEQTIDFVVISKISKENTILSARYESALSGATECLDSADPKLDKLLSNVIAFNLNPRSTLYTKQSKNIKEIIFIIDRSGSMSNSIDTLKNAMRLYLSSLPANGKVYINFISFGSSYKSLWKQSRLFDEETFKEASSFIDSIWANMGGTNILQPIIAATESLLDKIPNSKSDEKHSLIEHEIIVLTDGEVWNIDEVKDAVKHAVQKSNKSTRFYAFGIGDYVSHALLDVIWKSGNGYKQTVLINERMELKVSRMLQSALASHISGAKLYWQKDDSPIQDESEIAQHSSTVEANQHDFEMIFKYKPPLNFEIGKVPISTLNRSSSYLVTPEYGILPAFPYNDSKLYIFFEDSNEVAPSVKLELTLSDGSTDVIEVPIFDQSLNTKQEKEPSTERSSPSYLFCAAAKAILSDLSKSNLVSEFDKAYFGENIGVKFGIMSQWSSFVAIEKDGAEVKTQKFEESEQPDGRINAFSTMRGAGASGYGMPPPPPMAPSPALDYSQSTKSITGKLSFLSKMVPTGLTSGGSFARTRSIAPASPAPMPVMSKRSAVPMSAPLSVFESSSITAEKKDSFSRSDYDILAIITKCSNFNGSFSLNQQLSSIIFDDRKPRNSQDFYNSLKEKVLDKKNASDIPLPVLESLTVYVYMTRFLPDIQDSIVMLKSKSWSYIESQLGSESAKEKEQEVFEALKLR